MRTRLFLLIALPALAGAAAAQAPGSLEQERRDYAAWLASAPLSPHAAIALQPVGAGLRLGPGEVDIPLAGFPSALIVEERGAVVLHLGDERRQLPRNRAVPAGSYQFLATGPAGRTQVAVFGPVRKAPPPSFYPADPASSLLLELERPERRGRFRTLGLDGIETEAAEAGFVTVTLGGTRHRLRVYRMGGSDREDAELMIFFRDSTNGRGTYPAGRFVPVEPAAGGRWRVDFNRSRNPFCAYNTVYPCPAPWPGNAIPAPVEAGEKYVEGKE